MGAGQGWGGFELSGGGQVALFFGTHVNKIDKKGRVSVPARFRTVLSAQGFDGAIVYPSFVDPALDGCGLAHMEDLTSGLDQFDPYSEEYETFAHAIMTSSHEMAFDGEGRILLPSDLLAHAGISSHAAFVGMGRTFQIWEPDAHKARQELARGDANKMRGLMRSLRRGATEPKS